jgi:ubiquinol-cytochrome c reductase cytochrome b subunit
MLSNKQYDYLMFREALLKNINLHENLVNYIRPIEPLNSIEMILSQHYFYAWLIGFIETESCFSIYKPTKENSLVASFDISQKNGSILLEAIREVLSLTPKVYMGDSNSSKLKVSSVRAIENIVKFMQKAPVKLKGHKKLQYLLWLKELRAIPRYSNKFNIPDQY